jgi:hypothetical protein
MKKVVLVAAAAAPLGFAYGAKPSIAAPASPAQIEAPDSALKTVQMSERRMIRQRMMRRNMIRRNMMRQRMMRRNMMRRSMMRRRMMNRSM